MCLDTVNTINIVTRTFSTQFQIESKNIQIHEGTFKSEKMMSYHAILDCKPSKWERVYLEVLKNNDCRSLFILDSKTRK